MSTRETEVQTRSNEEAVAVVEMQVSVSVAAEATKPWFVVTGLPELEPASTHLRFLRG